MDFAHSLTQTQRLGLNQTLQQSLRILQMPQQELCELLLAELESNPLLESEEEDAASNEFTSLELFCEESDAQYPEERGENVPVEQTLYPNNDVYSPRSELSALDFASKGQSFSEMLREQLAGCRIPEVTARICSYLVDCLDSRGYLDGEAQEIADALNLPVFEVEQAIYFMQTLQPTGVCARNLEECLILQLVQSGDFNAHTIAIVKRGLALLADNKTAAIAAILHTDPDTAKAACDAIRRLNPLPSRGYGNGERSVTIIPDAVVRWEKESFTVQMNDKLIPKLRINEEYRGLLKKGCDSRTKDYVREKAALAGSLISCVENRGKTLFRVIERIVQLQPEFFRSAGGLHPMKMNELAADLGLDISTVSRTVSEKYIVCAAGVLPLRSVFTSGYATGKGAALSSTVVKKKIKEYIRAENSANPLSDEDIKSALELSGVSLSRRTVAKYREELGIASSPHRRR